MDIVGQRVQVKEIPVDVDIESWLFLIDSIFGFTAILDTKSDGQELPVLVLFGAHLYL